MSRTLPPRPNLEHLRKQAKRRLEELQRTDPTTQLADAQHDIARAYGVSNWTALHLHVESLRSALPDVTPEHSVAAGVTASEISPAHRSPIAGVWTANLATSKRHPLNPFQRATLEIEVAGDRVTIVHIGVDGLGIETRDQNTMLVDSTEHELGNGYLLMAKWQGTHRLETVAKKDGQVIGSGAYEVSPDGRTLTITGDQQRVVLERT